MAELSYNTTVVHSQTRRLEKILSESGEVAKDERTTTVYVQRVVAKHTRTQYNLSPSRADVLVVCSVQVFSSRIRALLYTRITSGV